MHQEQASAGGWRSRMRQPRWWFALALSLLIVVNVANFTRIDSIISAQRTRAFDRAPTADFFELALSNNNTRTRFDLYFALRVLAPGSTVELASDTQELRTVYTSYLFNVGHVDAVTESALTSAQWIQDMDPLMWTVAAGEGSSGGPPWLLALEDPTQALGDVGDPYDFVPHLIEYGDHQTYPVGPPREFVLLIWPLPGSGASLDDPPAVLLIDKALLSPAADEAQS